MKTSPDRKWPLPDDARELIDYLHIEDERTNGQPTLPADRLALARDWLVRIVLHRTDRLAHVAELKRRYRVSAGRAMTGGEVIRRTIFRHHELLSEQQTLSLAENGPFALAGDELGRLLLNPFALLDLTDLVEATLPAAWLDRHEVQARAATSEEEALDLLNEYLAAKASRPRHRERELLLRLTGGERDSSSAQRWELPAPEETVRAWLAEQMYGDAARTFTMTLYARQLEGRPDLLEFELEVGPAPTRNDLTLSARFPNNERRNFTLEVPPEVKADPTAVPRPRTRSEPCEPLPAVSCTLEEGASWVGFPPELVLRGYPSATA